MLKGFTVRIQVIKVYDVQVEAENEKRAIDTVQAMQSSEIEEKGEPVDVTTDFAEIVEVVE